MIPYEHTRGVGWARFFAWTSVGLGLAALIVSVTVPLALQLERVTWVVLFATFSIWGAFMAVPRYREAGRRVPWLIVVGAALGILTFALMVYAAVAFILAGYYDTVIPMLPNWTEGGTGSPAVPGIVAAPRT
ncbi:hypothetical protein [Agromyces sp. NPDC049794]|uniref:hypothetical protein n=1 Tax=unclassified Agromyces TaxID=2639701 RepID=UPI0033DDB609